MHHHSKPIDQFDEKGNRVRIINKMKTQNLMSLTVSFADQDTLSRIQKVFHSLSPSEIASFKDFLDNRNYLSRTQLNNKNTQILNKLCKIALLTEPKDLNLRKLYKEFQKNVDQIDKLKIQATETKDLEEVNDLIESINNLSDRNIELFEEVNRYSKNQTATS